MEEHNSQTTAMVITLNNVQLCRDGSDDVQQTDDIMEITVSRLKGTTALIAENSSDEAFMLSRALSAVRITPLTCLSGGQMIRAIQEHPPDLILASTHFLDINGTRILPFLKRKTLTGAIPVIVLGSDDTQQPVTDLPACAGYLVKPINVRKLYSMLDQLTIPVQKDDRESALPVLTRSAGPVLEYCRENPQFRDILNKDIICRVPRLTEGFNMTRIKMFADRITQLGQEFELPEMIQIGDTLSGYAHTFDVEKIEVCLSEIFGILTPPDSD